MPPIEFPISTAPGRHPHESQGRLINAYSEPIGDGNQRWRRAPGLSVFATPDPARSGFRGQILVVDKLYVAYSERLVYADLDGVVTDIATLPGSEPVTAARNNRTPTPQIVFVVPGTGAYSVDTTTVTQITDPDLPPPASVCFLDGYFFFAIPDGRCFASGLNDITINALDFTTAEAKPDQLVRGIVYNQELFLVGRTSIEVYANQANPTGFPFGRVAIIPRGVGYGGPRAMTGFEDGFDMGLLWVGDDGHVHRLEGYAERVISPPDLAANLLEHVADKTTIEMQSFMSAGHAFSSVSAPGFTWVYDWTTDAWHERASYNLFRWRGTGNTVSAFGKWLIGDSESNAVLAISDLAYREVDQPLIWTLESGPNSVFPNPLRVGPTWFDFVTGVGVADGADITEIEPQVAISWSDDGGTSWSNPVTRTLGQQGVAKREVEIRRTGRGTPKGRRWRLSIPDPVYVSFRGGEMDASLRRA